MILCLKVNPLALNIRKISQQILLGPEDALDVGSYFGLNLTSDFGSDFGSDLDRICIRLLPKLLMLESLLPLALLWEQTLGQHLFAFLNLVGTR